MRKARVILPRGITRCVFSTELQKSVDNVVDTVYKSHGKKTPFGDFRRSWWRYHCLQLGGPDACPYPPRDCALAFLRVAQLSVAATRPGAMFRVIAKDHAIKRLENKPLARERPSRSPSTQTDPGPMDNPAARGDRSRSTPSLPTPAAEHTVGGLGAYGHTLRRQISRPTRIGALLGGVAARPREVPTGDEPESA